MIPEDEDFSAGDGENNEQLPQEAGDIPTPITSFTDLGLRPEVMEAIGAMGFNSPSEVQVKAIPPALEGRDLLVQSRTGSGKTAAFAIPMAQGRVDTEQLAVQALCLAPTRELAIQVAEEVARITSRLPLRILPIYGGAAMGPQTKALKEGVHVVVGSPGRVLDHIRRGNFKTDAVRMLVLDECDEMLSMGFFEEISAIVDQLPKERQTLLFSATIPDDIQKMADRYLTDPVRLYLSEDFIGVKEIQHVYYLVSGGDRTGDLLRVLEYESPELALIFCNTRDDTSLVAEFLRRSGFAAEGISSDLSQADRERVMVRMRGGELKYLVATDIAARGIDISDISHVVNYTFPESADVYVHRTGRTGRAGKSGVAVSLVSPREIGSFYYLKLIHKIYPEERHLPSPQELATRREADRLARLEEAFAGHEAPAELRSLVQRLWSTLDGERLLALAVQHTLGELPAPLPAPAPAEKRAQGEQASAEEQPPIRRYRDEGEERPRGRSRRPEGGSRGRDREGRRPPREGRRDERGAAGRSDEGAAPRKTTRTRRRRDEAEQVQEGSFTTPDGDVEYWEVLAPRSGADSRPAAAEDTVRLFIRLGRNQGARRSDLVEFVQREADLDREQISEIQIRDNFSFINVPTEMADATIEHLAGKIFNDSPIEIERAKR